MALRPLYFFDGRSSVRNWPDLRASNAERKAWRFRCTRRNRHAFTRWVRCTLARAPAAALPAAGRRGRFFFAWSAWFVWGVAVALGWLALAVRALAWPVRSLGPAVFFGPWPRALFCCASVGGGRRRRCRESVLFPVSRGGGGRPQAASGPPQAAQRPQAASVPPQAALRP